MTGKRHLMKLFGALALTAAVAGCATSGPKYSEAKAALPPLAPENGRIFFYRTMLVGAAIQPSVKLNDVVVGSAVPLGYFYVDRPAGDYQVSITTEVTRTLSMTLQPGQVRYVKFDVSIGFFVGHVIPELVENATAEADLANCHAT